MQCFALRLLSDFTLMFQHCVGVLLKRDTDLAAKEVKAGRGRVFCCGCLMAGLASVVILVMCLSVVRGRPLLLRQLCCSEPSR